MATRKNVPKAGGMYVFQTNILHTRIYGSGFTSISIPLVILRIYLGKYREYYFNAYTSAIPYILLNK